MNRKASHPRTDGARRTVLALVLSAVLGVGSLVFVSPGAAAATATPTTYQDHRYGSGASAPSADKPQSKLWYNDGSWWALMANRSDVDIFELQSDHTWRDTGVVVDPRLNSTADALWGSNETLYIASRTAGNRGAIRVAKFTYAESTRTYKRNFVTKLPGGGTESVTVDRDSQGRLWASFTRGSAVWVTHSTSSPSSFVTPFRIPGVDTDISSDDISAVISLGDAIGVMWSDQASSAFRFAVHKDSDPDGVWSFESPLEGTRLADDHVNLKTLLGDDQGRVHAAVKTSLGDDDSDPSSSPGIMVLSRTAGGEWSSAVAATVAEQMTRPQLVLDRSNRDLYIFQSDERGGSVYYKSAPLSNISFGPGKGAPFIDWPGAKINNVSTAKAPVTSTTGLVAIASDSKDHRYYHAEMALDGSTPPPADEDTTAPTVTATSPDDGATGVAVDATASATFSEAMDAGSITGSTVTLEGPSGAVSAAVSYDAGAQRARLTPENALQPETVYTATVTTSVTDVAGNPLGSAQSWSFTTAAASGGDGGSETVTLTPVADSYVDTEAPSGNHGDEPVLIVDDRPVSRAYLKFDLSAYAGRTVQSASLQLRVSTSGSPGKQRVKLVGDDSWTETGLTYDNRPDLGSKIGVLGPTEVDSDYTVPLAASALQGELGEALSLGLDTGSGNGVDLASRETGTSPRLVLVLAG